MVFYGLGVLDLGLIVHSFQHSTTLAGEKRSDKTKNLSEPSSLDPKLKP